MPSTITTPNMGLIVPVNLVDTSPDWGARIQAAFVAIDSHNHTSGSGVQVPTAGLSINADLAFAAAGVSYNATSLRSSRFTAQGAPLVLGSDVGCVYVSGNELWYNDVAGRQVQLTNVGSPVVPKAFIYRSVSASYVVTTADQLIYAQSGSAAITLTLPASSSAGAGRAYYIIDAGQNATTNPITIAPNGADTINGSNASWGVNISGGLTILTTDGLGHWSATTIPPQPEGAAFATQALTTGTVTLAAAQLLKQCVQFTGTLTGNIVVVVPNGVASYQFDFSAVVLSSHTITIQSGSATTAALTNSNVGSTLTTTQLTYVQTYGGNTVRVKA